MPYHAMAELPEAVQKLGEDEQKRWMAAFNAAHAAGKTEEESAKIAWGAAKQAKESSSSLSFDGVRRLIDAALLKKWPVKKNQPIWPYIREIYGDYVVVDRDGVFWKIPYEIIDNAEVKLGKEEQVEQAWAASESLEITEAIGSLVAEPTGSKWRVRVFEYGLSKNRYEYGAPGRAKEQLPLKWTPQSAKAALPHLDGARCFADHSEGAKGGSVRDLIGFYSDPSLGAKGPEATLTVLESEEWAQRKMLAAWKIGRPLGFSVDAMIAVRPIGEGGARALAVEEIAAIKSCDLVSAASSGGAPLAVLEEQNPPAESGGNLSSAKRSNEKGAIMKETIKKVLESLRALPSVGESWLATATTIEAEAAKENADHGALLTKASEALSGAALEVAERGETVGEIDAQVTELQKKVEEAQKHTRIAESQMLLSQKLSDSKLPAALAKLVRTRYKGKECSPEELDSEIRQVREAYGAVAPGPARISSTPASVGLESRDKAAIGMQKLLGVTHNWNRVEEGQMIRMVQGEKLDSSIPAFHGIREAYVHFTGDRDVTGVIDPEKMRHVSEDWLPSSFPNVLGTSMTRLLLQGYMQPDFGLDLVVPQGNRKAIRDFRTQERIRVGYFGDLPIVDSKVANYAELTAPTDEKATYAILTRGGLVTIHRETIINDDLGFLNDTVNKLGRAARRTLAQRVYDLMINNAAIFDGVTWAHASSHGANLRTVALSAAEIEAVAQLMYLQTEKDSGKVIGIEAAILVIPRQLQKTAKDLNEHQKEDAAKNEAFHRFGPNSERIITCPLFTDATDFCVLANQDEVPCIELGFLQGRQEPEMWLQDQPTADRVFFADRITYKVRHEYEPVVIDYRGFAKNVVAG